MAKDPIDWFYTNLIHLGESHLAETIQQMYYVQGLDKHMK